MVDAYRWINQRAGITVLIALLLSLSACGNGGSAANPSGRDATSDPAPAETIELPLRGETFTLELALDDDTRTQGLSDRKSIADDGGMLFVFPYPRSTQFVMRRCYVPIDLIFIDEDGYIDQLHAMEVIEPIGSARWKNPFTGYPTAGEILYAVELKGGKIAKLGLKRGEKIDLPKAVLELTSE